MAKKATLQQLVEAIKKFTKPRQETWQNGSGSWKQWGCADWFCEMDGQVAKFKNPPKHGRECSLSLLEKYGATKKLIKVLADRAYWLDYEGGGDHSCPICKGFTEWKGVQPHHAKNCPGAVALSLVEVVRNKREQVKFLVR